MQTISLPYCCSLQETHQIFEWRREYSSAVRTAHKLAATPSEQGYSFADEKDVRNGVKARFSHVGTIDAWLLHCATRDGIAVRKRVPSGRTVFGGKDNMLRRQKGLISNEEWRKLRLRPLLSLGDKSVKGNRHFRLSEDGRKCTVRIYGKAVMLELPQMHGTWGKLLIMVAKLASTGEINVTFRLGKTLDVTFDEADLRKLPAGMTLQQANDEREGTRRRGRTRGASYVPPRDMWRDSPRPVHPEWRAPVPGVATRALGIDLNPGWVGLTVVETDGSLPGTNVLDYKLVRFDLPSGASNETVREALSAVVNHALSLARGWNVSVVGVEDGLGKLRSGGRNRSLNRLINHWARNALLSILERRCGLAGIPVCKVWAGYSTVIGNTAFDIPDACAAGAEIARRSLLRPGEDTLPEFCPGLVHRRWKHDAAVEADLRGAGTWQAYSRELRAARVGVRRPHPSLAGINTRSGHALVAGHVVGRLGLRHRTGLVARPTRQLKRPEQTEKRGDLNLGSTRYSE